MLSQEFVEQCRQKLLSLKDKFETELKSLPAHTELGSEEDDAANELEIDEVNQDLILQLRTDLEKVNKALAKIGDGTYGTDDQGREIGQDRLAALPYADTAI